VGELKEMKYSYDPEDDDRREYGEMIGSNAMLKQIKEMLGVEE
jgi:hypothetical protein